MFTHFQHCFFWTFGIHVIFAEIGIMQIIIFLCKKVFVHIKGSFQYIQKLVYTLTFEVLIRLGNRGRVQQQHLISQMTKIY